MACAQTRSALGDPGQRRAGGGWATPPHRGDIAQASLFTALLEAEIAEAEHSVETLEESWRRRCEKRTGTDDPPPDMLVRQRLRLTEARRLLAALRLRFPEE